MPDLFKQLIVVAIAIFVVIYILAVITGHAPLPSLSLFGGRG